LITTFEVDTERAKWIGYQFLFGFGLGVGMMQPNMAAQTVLTKKDVPIGSSLVFFGQSLGGAVFASVAQTIFTNKLKDNLADIGGLNIGAILNAGATNIKRIVPAEALPRVLVAYNDSLVDAFYVAVALVCVGSVGALTMEWRSIKNGEGQGDKKKPSSEPSAVPTEVEKV